MHGVGFQLQPPAASVGSDFSQIDDVVVLLGGAGGFDTSEVIVFDCEDSMVASNIEGYRLDADIIDAVIVASGSVLKDEPFNGVPVSGYTDLTAAPKITFNQVQFVPSLNKVRNSIFVSKDDLSANDVSVSGAVPAPVGVFGVDVSASGTKIEFDYDDNFSAGSVAGVQVAQGLVLMDASNNILTPLLAFTLNLLNGTSPQVAAKSGGSLISSLGNPDLFIGATTTAMRADIIILSSTTYQVLIWDKNRSFVIHDTGVLTASGTIAKLGVGAGMWGAASGGDSKRLDYCSCKISTGSGAPNSVSTVTFDLSSDGGSSYGIIGAVQGSDIVIPAETNTPGQFRVRVNLATSDDSVTPIVKNFSIRTDGKAGNQALIDKINEMIATDPDLTGVVDPL